MLSLLLLGRDDWLGNFQDKMESQARITNFEENT